MKEVEVPSFFRIPQMPKISNQAGPGNIPVLLGICSARLDGRTKAKEEESLKPLGDDQDVLFA